MTKGFFITATDTDMGKTTAALALMLELKRTENTVCAFKPVAAGCCKTDAGLRNPDALKLQAMSSIALEYPLINPYAYEAPIAPHIAAATTQQPIEIDHIKQCFDTIQNRADCIIVEGAGGWLVPINKQQSMADIAKVLDLPVVLVVGMKLGCINHSLLSAESIRQHGCRLAGWIANTIDPNMDNFDDNLLFLRQKLPAPLLAILPHIADKQDTIEVMFNQP